MSSYVSLSRIHTVAVKQGDSLPSVSAGSVIHVLNIKLRMLFTSLCVCVRAQRRGVIVLSCPACFLCCSALYLDFLEETWLDSKSPLFISYIHTERYNVLGAFFGEETPSTVAKRKHASTRFGIGQTDAI